jgi:hypothetical protein
MKGWFLLCSPKVLSPDPLPMPMRAVPASPMIVRTSAKSTLISPGLGGMKGRRKGAKKVRESEGSLTERSGRVREEEERWQSTTEK